MRACVAVVVAVAACKRAEPPKPAPLPVATVADGSAGGCVQLPFAESTPVPEASGAAWLTIDGTLSLVIAGDSGNAGAYGVIDPETGETREQGNLPLGDASEDIEGLAARGERLFGLTSGGWMREWKRRPGGFELVAGPYAIGPVDAVKDGGKAPKGVGNVCLAKFGNCGRNFEGLAIAPTPGACTGFACSKQDGRLYCLVERDGKLAADFTRSIAVDKEDALGDCAFSALSNEGTLWVGDNFLGLSQVTRIDGWAEPATAKPHAFEQLGVGFAEVIAVRDDVIYRMSDTGGAPSLMVKFRCPAIAR